MRTGALALLLLSLAPLAPSAAQPAATAPAPQAAEPAPDPARLEVARRLVAAMMPADAVQRMLGGGFPGMEGMMENMYDLSLADVGFGETEGMSEADRRRPMSEILAEYDPHFRERMAIRNRIFGEVLGEIFTEAAPEMQRVMAEIYARRFSLEDLNAALAYYSTPSGRRFIETSMTLTQDPAFARVMAGLAPRFVAAYGVIEERVRAASAHLPPEPTPPAADTAVVDAAED